VDYRKKNLLVKGSQLNRQLKRAKAINRLVESTNMNYKKVMLDALKGTAKSMPMSFGSMPSAPNSRLRKLSKQRKERSKSRMKQRNPGSSSYSFGAKYPGKP